LATGNIEQGATPRKHRRLRLNCPRLLRSPLQRDSACCQHSMKHRDRCRWLLQLTCNY
jgi:hypothetical protein